MPLQAYQNEDPLSIVWHDREVGPDRLAGCNGLIIQVPFPEAPVQMQVMGLGLGAFLGLQMKGSYVSELELTSTKVAWKRGEKATSRGDYVDIQETID